MIGSLLASFLLVSPVPPRQEPAGEADFSEFAARIEQTIRAGDPTFLDSRIDHEALLEATLDGLEVGAALRKDLIRNCASVFALGRSIVESLAASGGDYRFLRMQPGEQPRALFRMSSDSGLNYHELILRRNADRSISVVDAFIYLFGENLSATVRPTIMTIVARRRRGLLAHLLGRESTRIKAQPRITEMLQRAQTDPSGALEIYRSLPQEVRRQQDVLLARVTIAARVDEVAYVAAVQDVMKHWKSSPAVWLMAIDYHRYRGEFAQALTKVNAIDERVRDPYLDFIRGTILMDAELWDEARERIEAAVERDPELELDGLWYLLDLTLAAADHEGTLDCMIRLAEDFDIRLSDISRHDDFAAFVRSPQYERWLEHLGAAATSDG